MAAPASATNPTFALPPQLPVSDDFKVAADINPSTVASALSSQTPANPKTLSAAAVVAEEPSVQAAAARVFPHEIRCQIPESPRTKIYMELWETASLSRWPCETPILWKALGTLAHELHRQGYTQFSQFILDDNPTELFAFTATVNEKRVKLKIAPRDLMLKPHWLEKYMPQDASRGELCALAHLQDMNGQVVLLNKAFCVNRQGEEFSIDERPGADCYLVAQEFDFVPGKDLFYVLKGADRSKPDGLRLIFRCAIQVVNIIKNQHERSCANRDIKGPNFIFNQETGKVMGIDHDFMIYLPDSGLASSPKYTPQYCSLERLEALNRKEACDVFQADCWAVGVVLYELFTNSTLIEALSYLPGIEGYIKSFGDRLPDTRKYMSHHLRNADIPEKLIDPLAELFRELFDPDPQKRPSLEVVSERLTKIASQVES